MQKVRKFRLLRIRNHISCTELAHAAGVSPQRINQLELDLSYDPQKAGKRIDQAFERIIAKRASELNLLVLDFQQCRESLMEPVEEAKHEL